MAYHSYTKSRGNLSKGGYRITGNGRFWLIKFRKFNALPFIEHLDVLQLHLLRQLLSGFEDTVVVLRMARKLNLQAVSSLGAVQFSENLRCIILLLSSAKLTNLLFRDHSYNIAKSRGNLSKGESPEIVINTKLSRSIPALFFFVFVFAFSFCIMKA